MSFSRSSPSMWLSRLIFSVFLTPLLQFRLPNVFLQELQTCNIFRNSCSITEPPLFEKSVHFSKPLLSLMKSCRPF